MNSTSGPRLVVALLFAAVLLAACGGDEPAATAADGTAPTLQVTVASPTEAPAVQPTSARPTAAPTIELEASISPSSPTAAPAGDTPPALPADLPGDPKAAILQAMRNQLTAGPYRTVTTVTMDGASQTIEGSVIPPDRARVVMDLGGMTSEMIYIGDKVWSRQGDGAWAVTDRMGAPGGAFLDESMITDSEATISDAVFAGEEEVGGVRALVYGYTSDLSKSERTPLESITQVRIWVDAATGLVIRQEIVDTSTETPSKTVQSVDYDPAIKIEPPQ